MTLTKGNIVDSVYKNTDLKRLDAVRTFETLIEIVKERLESGEKVVLSGFGRFAVKEKQVRKGRNPQTGDDLMLGARRVVTFKCSGKLREKINGGVQGKKRSRKKARK